MGSTTAPFRVGRVRAHRRGKVWYLTYFEQGRRRQPRVGPERDAARRMAAEINAQLECGAPSAVGFEGVAISELRKRWLDNHEYVRRSSLATIRRYEAATKPLLSFLDAVRPLRQVSDFRPQHAEEFFDPLKIKEAVVIIAPPSRLPADPDVGVILRFTEAYSKESAR
jgi:integrase